jgi:hypothetical protein
MATPFPPLRCCGGRCPDSPQFAVDIRGFGHWIALVPKRLSVIAAVLAVVLALVPRALGAHRALYESRVPVPAQERPQRPDHSQAPKPIWVATWNTLEVCLRATTSADRFWRDDHNGLFYVHYAGYEYPHESLSLWYLDSRGRFVYGWTHNTWGLEDPRDRAIDQAQLHCLDEADTTATYFGRIRHATPARERPRRPR